MSFVLDLGKLHILQFHYTLMNPNVDADADSLLYRNNTIDVYEYTGRKMIYFKTSTSPNIHHFSNYKKTQLK